MANQAYRPKLQVPPSTVDLAVELTSVVGLIIQALIVAHFWPVLPHSVVTHFGANGEPNEWAPKYTVLIFPGLSILTWVGFTILNRFPHTFNYPVQLTPENAERQYGIAISFIRWLKMEMVWLLLFINYQLIMVSLGRARGIDYSLIFVLFLTATVIIFLVRAYRAK